MSNCHGVCGLCVFKCTKVHFIGKSEKSEKTIQPEPIDETSNLPIIADEIVADYEIKEVKPSLKDKIFRRSK